jgi:hypothetical protein
MLLRTLLPAFVLAAVVGFALGAGGSRSGALAEPVAPAGDLGPRPSVVAPTVARAAAARPKPAAAERAGVDAYRGAGAWVDMYDPAELGNPWPALVEMQRGGVRTLYLETASWRVPKSLDMKDEQAVALFLDEAHALGMKVIAWYLPGFDDLRTDLRRSRAVLDYRTPDGGQSFDGFAVDIESQRVGPVPARNAALLRYSRALRRAAGPDYALGAITPDLRSSTVSPGLWPGFPFAALAPLYDVFLPMAYSSIRGHGAAYVAEYSRANVSTIRALTGRPVHLIGGLSSGLGPGEHAAAVRGARAGGAIGASFYDFSIGQDDTWRALRPYR